MIIEYENWYTRHQDIIREAGMKETVGGIIGAIVLILYGLTLQDASQRMQVPEQEVVSAMEDEAAVEKARRIMKKETQREKMPEDAPPTDEMIITKNIIARTIYAEGQSESEEGKIAIATVIYNRGRGNPNTIVKVIQSPKQFSCWNSADSNDWTNMKQGKGNSWEESHTIITTIRKKQIRIGLTKIKRKLFYVPTSQSEIIDSSFWVLGISKVTFSIS